MAQVVSHYTEFKTLDTNLVAISFGSPYWAQAWRKEAHVPFSIWLDPERQSYRAYGLEKSVLRSWGLNNLRYYAHALLKGETLHGYRGDTNQLGGNFIVDAQGIVQFAYPSHDPTDRPSVEHLLMVLRRLN